MSFVQTIFVVLVAIIRKKVLKSWKAFIATAFYDTFNGTVARFHEFIRIFVSKSKRDGSGARRKEKWRWIDETLESTFSHFSL